MVLPTRLCLAWVSWADSKVCPLAVGASVEWLAGDARRRIVHSKYYNEPSEFKGQHVLVVGGTPPPPLTHAHFVHPNNMHCAISFEGICIDATTLRVDETIAHVRYSFPVQYIVDGKYR